MGHFPIRPDVPPHRLHFFDSTPGIHRRRLEKTSPRNLQPTSKIIPDKYFKIAESPDAFGCGFQYLHWSSGLGMFSTEWGDDKNDDWVLLQDR